MQTPDKTNWLLVAMLFVAGLFAAAQFSKFSLTFPELRLIYPAATGFIPFLVTLVGIVGIVFGAVAGALVARGGVRRVLLWALGGGAVISGLEALLPALPVMALLRVAEGVSHLAIVVAIPTLMAAISTDRDRPVVMAIWAMFFGVSFALSAVIFPPLLAFGGLPVVFALHGAGFALVALVLAPLLPRARVTKPPSLSYIAEHRVIYASPRLILPALGFVWYTLTYIALLALLPSEISATPSQIATLPLASLVGTFAAGVLARRFEPDRIAIAGFVGTIVMSILLAITGMIWVAVAMMLIMGLVPGASFAAIPHFNLSGTDRARATGALAQMGNVGTTFGTPLFALATSIGGLTGLMALTVLLALCAVGCLIVIRGRIGPG